MDNRIMRLLPEILNQGGTSMCSSYAVAGLANYFLGTERVDAKKLYQETTFSGGNTLGSVLAKATINGIPLTSGKRVKIKSSQRVLPGALNLVKVLEKNPVVFSYQIPLGIGMRCLPPDYIMQWPLETHSMVLLDYDEKTKCFWVANSYGDQWADRGYFRIPAMRMDTPYCNDVYSFTLEI